MKTNTNMNRKIAGDVTSPKRSLQRTVRRDGRMPVTLGIGEAVRCECGNVVGMIHPKDKRFIKLKPIATCPANTPEEYIEMLQQRGLDVSESDPVLLELMGTEESKHDHP